MNKKIIVCLLSFFSMAVIGAEQEMKVRSAKRREAEELQPRRTKKVKMSHNEPGNEVRMENLEVDSFSFEDMKKSLEEIMCPLLSQKEQESMSKASVQKVEEADSEIKKLIDEVMKVAQQYNFYYFLEGKIDPGRDGAGIKKYGELLAMIGEKRHERLEQFALTGEDPIKRNPDFKEWLKQMEKERENKQQGIAELIRIGSAISDWHRIRKNYLNE